MYEKPWASKDIEQSQTTAPCSVVAPFILECHVHPSKKHVQIQIIFPGIWYKVPGEILNFDKLSSVFVYELKGLEHATSRNGGQEIEMCFVGRILLVLGDTRLCDSLGVKWNASLRQDSAGMIRL